MDFTFTSHRTRPRSDNPIWKRGSYRTVAYALALLLLVPTGSKGQARDPEIQSLREEVRQLRAELEALRAEVRSGGVAEPSGLGASRSQAYPATAIEDSAADQAGSAAAELLPLLQAQVDEHAQTKVESNSRMPVRLFGTILSNTFFNSGEANWLDAPNVVPPAAGLASTGSFSSTLRQSRLGAIIDGPDVGGFSTTGVFALDFFGGVPSFKTGQTMGIPRLLYRFMRLENDNTAVQIGQDLMVLAPQNPTSLAAFSFPNLFYSGNLYLRVPQARVERTFQSGRQDQLELQLGITAPVSGDIPTDSFTFVPPNLPGERSRRPAVQGRLAWRREGLIPGEPLLELAASGHYGTERRDSGDLSSWVGALDFMAIGERFGAKGEFWVGQNVDAFGGSVGQLAKSRGGFFEGKFRPSEQLEFNGGFGIDSLFDQVAFPADLEENSTFFANTIYQFTPEFATSLEWRRLLTTPTAGKNRTNHHLNLVFAYSF